jgi:hypothetical protein
MTTLGKCLVFYFKYQSEMRRLYWSKQTPEDMANQETMKMVNAIGDKCRQEVRDFLTECSEIIEKHFETVGHCAFNKLNDSKWTVSYGVWTGYTPKSKKWRMQAGVDIAQMGTEIIPWLWGSGKDRFEERVAIELNGSVVPVRSAEIQMQSGHVALTRIPIPLPKEGFDVDPAALLQKVAEAFSSVPKYKFENLYSFAKDC